MIEKIVVNQAASYTEPVEMAPTEINYIFGSNGAGKTVLSKLIDHPKGYPNSEIVWNSEEFETLVYNRDFVKDNFSQKIKGIFTLGKDSKEAQQFISDAKAKIDLLATKLDRLNESFGQKKEQEERIKVQMAEKCWRYKVEYEDHFRQAYVGHMGSINGFFEKCLSEKSNTAELLSKDDLITKSKAVFSSNLASYETIPELDYSDLTLMETSSILSTKIVGKEDIRIAELIKRLDNSDWVRSGVSYLATAEDKCPFCQQNINETLKNEIESFFDETYSRQCQNIEDFKSQYVAYVKGLLHALEGIAERTVPIIDYKDLIATVEMLQEIFKKNVLIIDSKIKSPSLVVTIDTIEPVLIKIEAILAEHRNVITKNNNTVKNINTEKSSLKNKIWRFILNELEIDLTAYERDSENIKKAKNSLSGQIKATESEKKGLEDQVKLKESEVTSVDHTVNEINKILGLFGFTNFRLAKSEELGFYQIIRTDGTVVNETLSEGEYTFITFLYFYQLLKGSIEESGMTRDKVVVIDDPISSLDSNVLFVVSNLIKEIVRDCRSSRNGIKQIFILTHNIYFHKEVTFKGAREKDRWKEESYWIIRKQQEKSKIIPFDSNPIQTTYELLWREISNTEDANKATIHNTLRRILEYYFNIIGGLDYEKCINEFEGEEKIICKSLVSWVNDGSHFINDDLIVYTEPESIEKYLIVFEAIFDKMGHISHYQMMMKTEAKAEVVPAA